MSPFLVAYRDLLRELAHPLVVGTALLALTGCGTPPALPAVAPSATGTTVHITSDDPALPLTLYRAEPDFAGLTYGRTGGRAPSNAFAGRPQGTVGDDATSQLDTRPGYVPRFVCLAPCDQRVDDRTPEGLFLGGDGIRPSSTFHLPRGATQVEIRASPKSAAPSTVGTVLVPVGAGGVFLGGLLALGTLVTAGSTDRGSLARAGGGLLGAGAVLLGTGIVLVVTGKTTYSVGKPDVAVRF